MQGAHVSSVPDRCLTISLAHVSVAAKTCISLQSKGSGRALEAYEKKKKNGTNFPAPHSTASLLIPPFVISTVSQVCKMTGLVLQRAGLGSSAGSSDEDEYGLF